MAHSSERAGISDAHRSRYGGLHGFRFRLAARRSDAAARSCAALCERSWARSRPASNRPVDPVAAGHRRRARSRMPASGGGSRESCSSRLGHSRGAGASRGSGRSENSHHLHSHLARASARGAANTSSASWKRRRGRTTWIPTRCIGWIARAASAPPNICSALEDMDAFTRAFAGWWQRASTCWSRPSLERSRPSWARWAMDSARLKTSAVWWPFTPLLQYVWAAGDQLAVPLVAGGLAGGRPIWSGVRARRRVDPSGRATGTGAALERAHSRRFTRRAWIYFASAGTGALSIKPALADHSSVSSSARRNARASDRFRLR